MFGRLRFALASAMAGNERRPIIQRTARRDAIAITFDDGPSPATTPAVLDLLRAHRATATFFLCGERVARHPALVAAMVAEGHAVYAHGFDHVRMDALSNEDFFSNLDRTEMLLRQFRPTPDPYFVRLPYGSGHRSIRVHRLLHEWQPGCVVTDWGYSPEDFRLADGCDTEADLARACALAAERAIASPRLAGSILLLHEDPLDIEAPLAPRIAPVLLAEILTRAGQHGLSFTGLSAPRRRIATAFSPRVAVG
jgi:peptidoglycan/xylan/chitin deacetylase (PgdA/CDA1 family)